MTARYEVRDGIAVITLDNPPINGLGYDTRRGIGRGLEAAQANAAVRAIVITGGGRMFSGGADVNELGTPRATAEPTLPSLIVEIENAAKPVVAAIHGAAMAGGLELALACHYRLATPDAQIAMPEVKVGLIPGAGGTQRLPRAVGVDRAIDMIASGDPVAAEVLAQDPGQRLIDRTVEPADTLLDEALAFARVLPIAEPFPLLRDLACPPPADPARFDTARADHAEAARHVPAPLRAIDAIEIAATAAFADGLAAEREIFLPLMLVRPEFPALRHVYAASRAAPRVDDLPADTPQRTVTSVAIVGAGTMGSGIAMAFLKAGYPVTLLERDRSALDRGVAAIQDRYAAQIAKGRMEQADADTRLARLQPTLDYDDLGDADLVVETVFEDMAVKEEVFRTLDRVARPGAILTTNTSTLDVDRIAAFTSRPHDVVGMHFFTPANVMKLLEVVRGARTAPDVLATVLAVAGRLGKTAVVAGVCDGFIGNRMIGRFHRQAWRLLDEGASPQQIDAAMEAFGFGMGPFRMTDLTGIDVVHAIRRRQLVERPHEAGAAVIDRLHELGRFGLKTRAGWYDYATENDDAMPSALVDGLVADHRRAQGYEARAITDEEIVQRLVYALVNEGARVLEEGIAARAGDIDVVQVLGFAFPAHRGGPMHYAHQVGLPAVLPVMRRFHRLGRGDGAFWQPATSLEHASVGASSVG